MAITNEELKKIELFAKRIRIEILKSLNNLGFGHYGGSLSVVEALAVLYGSVMNVDVKNPKDSNRDYFVLSKGHAGPAFYATLALKGFFPVEELSTLNQNKTNLPSHPDRLKTIGVDATTGSLGQGISIAAGIAKGIQLDKKKNRVFCIVGDGELNEGQCWEAFQFIRHHNLNNLIIFVDYNKQQLDGELSNIIDPLSLEEKFIAFGYEVKTVKGDDISGIYEVVSKKRRENEPPIIIILDSKKGQGISLIESMKNSHHLRLTEDLKKKLDKEVEKLEQEVKDFV